MAKTDEVIKIPPPPPKPSIKEFISKGAKPQQKVNIPKSFGGKNMQIANRRTGKK